MMPPTNSITDATEPALPYSLDYPPPDFMDPVIEAYKKDLDVASLCENLKLTMDERLRKYKAFLQSRDRWCGSANRAEHSDKT